MCSSYGNALHLDSGCHVLQFASYSFDVSIVDIVDTLTHGACLCIPSEYDRVNNIVEVMNKMRVTWADLTPSFAGTFTAAAVPTLQTLVLAGEEVQQGEIERWAGKLRLINCYGPAESSACTACEYSSPVDQAGTIGYPMTHANCWVVDLDAPDRLASIYSPGELVVESPALARGYLNNPEKTQASFIHDPDWLPACDLLSGRRVYMTGDLVRYQPDGSLKFLGRKDSQVKIRGQRVEPSEVEHHLSMYPAMAKCIIAYPKSGCYAKHLVAVIQSRVVSSSMMDDRLRLLSFREVRNTGFDTNEATKYLKRVLPAYMNPTDWVAVESIPLTSSKKLDRKRVEVWLEGLYQKQNPGDVGPSNMSDLRELSPDEPVALKISTIVADVCANGDTQLRKALEGHDFAFSTVGINSTHVISISRCIEREFNVKVGVERLTNNETTIRTIAAEIEHSKENASSVTLPATIDVAKEVATFYKELLSTSPEQQRKQNLNVHPIENDFLTGATGFLGTQLLRQLLWTPSWAEEHS
jgi:acyl carrier protein